MAETGGLDDIPEEDLNSVLFGEEVVEKVEELVEKVCLTRLDTIPLAPGSTLPSHFSLTKGRNSVKIGRATKEYVNTFVVANTTVSRIHCELYLTTRGAGRPSLYIRDRSNHGTFRNGVKLPKDQEVALNHSDQISLSPGYRDGGPRFLVEYDDLEQIPPTDAPTEFLPTEQNGDCEKASETPLAWTQAHSVASTKASSDGPDEEQEDAHRRHRVEVQLEDGHRKQAVQEDVERQQAVLPRKREKELKEEQVQQQQLNELKNREVQHQLNSRTAAERKKPEVEQPKKRNLKLVEERHKIETAVEKEERAKMDQANRKAEQDKYEREATLEQTLEQTLIDCLPEAHEQPVTHGSSQATSHDNKNTAPVHRSKATKEKEEKVDKLQQEISQKTSGAISHTTSSQTTTSQIAETTASLAGKQLADDAGQLKQHSPSSGKTLDVKNETMFDENQEREGNHLALATAMAEESLQGLRDALRASRKSGARPSNFTEAQDKFRELEQKLLRALREALTQRNLPALDKAIAEGKDLSTEQKQNAEAMQAVLHKMQYDIIRGIEEGDAKLVQSRVEQALKPRLGFKSNVVIDGQAFLVEKAMDRKVYKELKSQVQIAQTNGLQSRIVEDAQKVLNNIDMARTEITKAVCNSDIADLKFRLWSWRGLAQFDSLLECTAKAEKRIKELEEEQSRKKQQQEKQHQEREEEQEQQSERLLEEERAAKRQKYQEEKRWVERYLAKPEKSIRELEKVVTVAQHSGFIKEHEQASSLLAQLQNIHGELVDAIGACDNKPGDASSIESLTQLLTKAKAIGLDDEILTNAQSQIDSNTKIMRNEVIEKQKDAHEQRCARAEKKIEESKQRIQLEKDAKREKQESDRVELNVNLNQAITQRSTSALRNAIQACRSVEQVHCDQTILSKAEELLTKLVTIEKELKAAVECKDVDRLEDVIAEAEQEMIQSELVAKAEEALAEQYQLIDDAYAIADTQEREKRNTSLSSFGSYLQLLNNEHDATMTKEEFQEECIKGRKELHRIEQERGKHAKKQPGGRRLRGSSDESDVDESDDSENKPRGKRYRKTKRDLEAHPDLRRSASGTISFSSDFGCEKLFEKELFLLCASERVGKHPGSRQLQKLEKEEDLANDSKEFHPGDRVTIHGLQNAAHVNGQSGILMSFIESEQRWQVQLQDGQMPTLKPQNIALQDDILKDEFDDGMATKAVQCKKKLDDCKKEHVKQELDGSPLKRVKEELDGSPWKRVKQEVDGPPLMRVREEVEELDSGSSWEAWASDDSTFEKKWKDHIPDDPRVFQRTIFQDEEISPYRSSEGDTEDDEEPPSPSHSSKLAALLQMQIRIRSKCSAKKRISKGVKEGTVREIIKEFELNLRYHEVEEVVRGTRCPESATGQAGYFDALVRGLGLPDLPDTRTRLHSVFERDGSHRVIFHSACVTCHRPLTIALKPPRKGQEGIDWRVKSTSTCGWKSFKGEWDLSGREVPNSGPNVHPQFTKKFKTGCPTCLRPLTYFLEDVGTPPDTDAENLDSEDDHQRHPLQQSRAKVKQGLGNRRNWHQSKSYKHYGDERHSRHCVVHKMGKNRTVSRYTQGRWKDHKKSNFVKKEEEEEKKVVLNPSKRRTAREDEGRSTGYRKYWEHGSSRNSSTGSSWHYSKLAKGSIGDSWRRGSDDGPRRRPPRPPSPPSSGGPMPGGPMGFPAGGVNGGSFPSQGGSLEDNLREI